jgi:tyrosyl-tRNA synthetase
VELGGTDQRFNLLVGRDLQREEGQEPQSILVNPLVPGTDGAKKMSKSAGNYVGITESPDQQFGKTMSIPDALMGQWFESFTEVPSPRVDELLAGHPRTAKGELAKAIVARWHGAAAAAAAAEEFTRVFSKKEVPDEMPEISLAAGPARIVDLLVAHGLAASKGEAKRLVQQGGVSIDGAKVAAPDVPVDPPDGAVLKVGKLRFARIRRA